MAARAQIREESERTSRVCRAALSIVCDAVEHRQADLVRDGTAEETRRGCVAILLATRRARGALLLLLQHLVQRDCGVRLVTCEQGSQQGKDSIVVRRRAELPGFARQVDGLGELRLLHSSAHHSDQRGVPRCIIEAESTCARRLASSDWRAMRACIAGKRSSLSIRMVTSLCIGFIVSVACSTGPLRTWRLPLL